MEISYKGVKEADTDSRRAICLETIREHYGCLSKFLEDIELKIKKNG